ncbi:recombinase family protein [Longimycelium tulufanense]|uniref:Recombinase family protein n=1 Tax=Longimycelium tulufanense TaxID=907463 RepID=A0A8J3C6C9_9PSEU|nr:recombinase family protein [Longimycelium tulufanense]GGM39666.1 recombinase family protein [Longimycelium tulufanense]
MLLSERRLRALVGSRVSVKRNNRKHKSSAKVSHIAQKEIGYRAATGIGADVVDFFEDLDVSATVSPFERPDLRDWLDIEQRGHEWDVIIWSSLDRGFRDPKDAIDLAKWCEENQKIMILAEQGITLDYRADGNEVARMMGEAFLLIGSMFAKWELKNHQTRALNAHSFLRELDRWAGGPAPEGFQIIPHPYGKGKTLDTDPRRKELLHFMAYRLLGCQRKGGCNCGAEATPQGDSFNGITIWLTQKKYLTNVDRHREPEDRRHNRWHVSDVIDALTSPATQGIKMSGGKPVLGKDGMPIQIAPPTFDPELWAKIQAAVEKRRRGYPNRVHGANPLLGVCFCGKCEASATQFVTIKRSKATPEGTKHRYYRCARRPKSCPKVGMKADQVEEILAQEFLEQCGDLPVMERIFIPGEDHTEELSKVKASIARLERESDMGLIRTQEDEERHFERMKALVDRRTALEALPQREAAWEYRKTGQTYGDAWRAAENDVVARRKLLVDAGVRFVIHGQDRWEVQIPKDIRERLKAAK